MAVPQGTVRVVLSASLPGGEEMAHRFHITDGGALATPVFLEDVALAAANAWSAALDHAQGAIAMKVALSSTVVYNPVKVYALDAAGHATDAVEAPILGTKAGTSGNSPLPNAVAACISLLTAKPGKSFRGRMYLGGIQVGAVGPDGLMVSAYREALAGGVAHFFDRMQRGGLPSPEAITWTPVILSPTKSVVTPITSVACGNVFDTQRRRRASQIESRLNIGLPLS